jgi:asparagine synthetase B (glutamine-hydrolysing)
MCSIVGIVASSSSVEELSESVERMKAALVHRGPNGEETLCRPEWKAGDLLHP